MMEVHLERRTDPSIRMFGVLVASFVLAALPVAVSPNPVYNAYYPAPSYQSAYEPSYQPAYPSSSYEPSYQPAPAYEPSYQPAYEPAYPQSSYPQPAYEPSYQPAYESRAYQPAYEAPAYQPAYEAPAYQPAYEAPAPAYQPAYEAPAYQPAYEAPAYQPAYEAPAYQPAYEAPAYQPAYEPAYQPAYPQPAYEPSYQPAYEPTYPAPSYPTPSYKPSYEPAYQPKPAYQPSYEPTYQPKPAYQPSYEPAYEPKPAYQPSYEPAYEPKPAYQPSYEPAYQPKPAYQPAYQAYAPTYRTEYYPEYANYEAITYRDLNESIHCGIIPAVNSELYKNNYGGYQYQADYSYGKSPSTNLALTTPTLPFGNYPWTVLVTDDYNNILCQATSVNSRFVLTLSSCVDSYPLHKLRIRFGDWDIRNDANEYEAYKNVESRICRKFPVTCPYGYPAPSYGYGYQQRQPEASTGLTLLEAEFEPDNDVYPHTRSVCLPEYYTTPSYQPAYKAPAYQPAYKPAPAPYTPSYQAPQAAYQPSTYAAAPYVAPPTYNEPTYVYYSECYVAGYYGSPTTKLQNHKRPTPYEGYGYQSPPSYPQSQAYSSYSYESYDSKIPKVAKVKQIKCDSYGAYQRPAGYGYGQSSCEENLCFVGVDGDACVADFGSAVICLIPEKEGYDAGYSYSSEQSSYGYPSPSYPTPSYQPAPAPAYSTYSSSYPQSSYYKKEIRATVAQDKVDRKRAAIVAVVETPAQCSSTYKQQKYGYGYQAQEYQSKPIVAIKVTEKVVNFILEKFFEGAEDHSCPALTFPY